jgi:hypothetical protein
MSYCSAACCVPTEVKKTRSSKNGKSEKQQREIEAVCFSVSRVAKNFRLQHCNVLTLYHIVLTV